MANKNYNLKMIGQTCLSFSILLLLLFSNLGCKDTKKEINVSNFAGTWTSKDGFNQKIIVNKISDEICNLEFYSNDTLNIKDGISGEYKFNPTEKVITRGIQDVTMMGGIRYYHFRYTENGELYIDGNSKGYFFVRKNDK